MIHSVLRKASSLAGSQLFGWTNYNKILESDGVCSQSQIVGHNAQAPFLKISAYGDPVPDDATIVGIKLHITARNQYASNTGFGAVGASAATGSGGIRLLGLDGTVGRGMTAFTRNTLTTKELGGESDLWGAVEVTPAQANALAFGVFASFRNGDTRPQSMFLDGIEVEFFYTLPD